MAFFVVLYAQKIANYATLCLDYFIIRDKISQRLDNSTYFSQNILRRKIVKKFKIVACICILMVALVSIFMLGHNKNIKAFAEEDDGGFTQITSIEEITDSEGKYILKNDIVLDEGISAGVLVFSGELNGNGYHVTSNTGAGNSLFSELSGAYVHDLVFSNKANTEKPFINRGGHAVSNGFLANYINGSKIENILFENCAIYHVAAENFDIIESGMISGKITNSEISQIKIKDSSMNVGYYYDNAEGIIVESPIATNANIGVLCGTVSACKIKNCVVENVIMNYALCGNVKVKEYNIGGIVGVAENTKFINNIVNLYEQSQTEIIKTISINSDVTISANIGGLIGKVISGEKTQIINNFVMFDEGSFAISETIEKLNIGSMVGNLFYAPTNTNVNGFLTTYAGELFGVNLEVSNYSKMNVEGYDNISVDAFSDNKFWNIVDEYKWNFTDNWMIKQNNKYPLLQVYEKFTVQFDSTESKASLMLPVLPQGDVVLGKLSVEDNAGFEAESLSNVPYGAKLFVNVSLVDANNYSSYFSISALEINGKLVYDNETNNSLLGYDIQCLYNEEVVGNCTYVISNFNANMSGTLTVRLKPITYKLNVKVYDLGDEEMGSIIPGGFKVGSSETKHNYVLDMEYGKNYRISTSLANLDYSDRCLWYIYDNTATDGFGEVLPFAYNTTMDNMANLNSNVFDFTFTENPEECKLLMPVANDPIQIEKTYFDINKYTPVTLEDGTLSSNYELILVYTKRVKEIKIVLKYEDSELPINEMVAKILIDNKSDRIIWNEEEGVFYAKLAFDDSRDIPYTIKLSEMGAGMEFAGWYDDIAKLDEVEGDPYSTIITISADPTEDTFTIYCMFKSDVTNVGADLLWLWILIGAVVLVAIIIITIVIIKRRGSGGGGSYKKYYY